MKRQIWTVAGLAATLCSAGAWADDEVTATPYRPTVSNPAELSAPGWLELEFGGARQHDSDTRRTSWPYAAKLAFNENWGLILGGDLHVRESSATDSASSGGDTTLTLKHRIASGDKDQNFGIEAGVKLPTAGAGLGSGHADWNLNGIYSLDINESWRLDANVGATRLGIADPGQSRWSVPWSAALARSLGAWTLAAELSGAHQRGVPNGSQWLAAASYACSARLVLDAGFSRGLQSWSDQRTVFLGLTWTSAKLL